MGSDRSFLLVRKMYAFCLVELSRTKCSEQTDFERSFFGNGQGETIEFGAGQCMTFPR